MLKSFIQQLCIDFPPKIKLSPQWRKQGSMKLYHMLTSLMKNFLTQFRFAFWYSCLVDFILRSHELILWLRCWCVHDVKVKYFIFQFCRNWSRHSPRLIINCRESRSFHFCNRYCSLKSWMHLLMFTIKSPN
jgi:hypothetical protein